MARMSIDDMVQRDPRITKLATLVGWSRRETMGCLILDVWPICYDQREHTIAAELIDIAAAKVGFAAAMVESGLADWARGNVKVRIRGAKERIEYLDHKKRAGHVGGLKSAALRNKISSTGGKVLEQRGSTPQAAGNPSVPDPASAYATPTVPDHTHGPVAAAPGVESVGLTELKQRARRSAADRAAAVPPRAWKAADYMRGLVLAEDPKAAVGRQPWGDEVLAGTRLAWADCFRLMVERDARTYEEIADTLNYLFNQQPATARFVVQSPDSLREKWDRIQAVRRNRVEAVEPQQPMFRKVEEL